MGKTEEQNNSSKNDDSSGEKTEKLSRNWLVILWHIYLHIFFIIGLYILFTKVKWMTVFYFLFLIMFSYVGLTVGAHRLYAHQTFTATSQLKFFLVLAHTLAAVGPIYNWVLWHRLHHKYHNTNKDPYDHRKGFFYSHVLSNLQSTSSDMQSYLKNIDMRDVDSDRIVWVQQKFYWIFFAFALILPVYIPVAYWGELWMNSLLVLGATRLVIMTHIAWLVNSALLVWGLKKGDRFPVNDNSVFFLSKSYWPNYHYLIPWDWKNDEFGLYERGFSTFMIKMWYEMGLIDEMKTVTNEDVREILEKIATSKDSMEEILDQMKEKSQEEAFKRKLMYRP